jgi:DNA-binding MarR family transcriptional regulator
MDRGVLMFDPKSRERRRTSISSGKVEAVNLRGLTAPVRQLTDLVEQLNRIVYGLGFTAGLNPAQWAALRYLSRSDDGPRTVGGLAQHQGVTAPTASETVSALVRKGLVVRQPSETDKRSHGLALTAEGERMLGADPIFEVASAIEQLSESQRACLGEALGAIAPRLQERRRELRDRR